MVYYLLSFIHLYTFIDIVLYAFLFMGYSCIIVLVVHSNRTEKYSKSYASLMFEKRLNEDSHVINNIKESILLMQKQIVLYNRFIHYLKFQHIFMSNQWHLL